MIIKEFLGPNRKLTLSGGNKSIALQLGAMDQPELSLGPSVSIFGASTNCSSSESDASICRKRKQTCDEQMIQTNIELHLSDPLPLDWEQCLDLHSGRMYYLNRKTLKKSWNKPQHQKIDLELNMSTFKNSDRKVNVATHVEPSKQQHNSSGNMVAVVCVNCHLLVMICKSAPFCPNCKFMNLLTSKPSAPRRVEAVKSLETLNLLH